MSGMQKRGLPSLISNPCHCSMQANSSPRVMTYGTQSLSGFIQAAEVLTERTVIPKNVFIMHCYLLGGTLLRALKTLNVMTTQEVDTVKITSHRNKKILALQCFLIVKSFLSVVSQFALLSRTLWLGTLVASSALSRAERALLAPVQVLAMALVLEHSEGSSLCKG